MGLFDPDVGGTRSEAIATSSAFMRADRLSRRSGPAWGRLAMASTPSASCRG